MTTNYDKFSRFITENTKDPTIVASNMELIRPLFEMAEKGEFKFGKAEDLNLVETATAISLAIGKPITKIVPVSKSNPFPKPDWMSEMVHSEALHSLLDNLGNRLLVSLGNNLEDNLGDNLTASLWNNLGASLVNNLGFNLGFSLGDSLGTCLILLFGFVLLNKTNKIEQLRPLVRCLSNGYIPIGFKADEPGAYMVMVA